MIVFDYFLHFPDQFSCPPITRNGHPRLTDAHAMLDQSSAHADHAYALKKYVGSTRKCSIKYTFFAYNNLLTASDYRETLFDIQMDICEK